MNLLAATKEKLTDYTTNGGTLQACAKASGLNYSWLRRFNQGKANGSSVETVQALHDWLQQELAHMESQ